jgi:hypothetical protein
MPSTPSTAESAPEGPSPGAYEPPRVTYQGCLQTTLLAGSGGAECDFLDQGNPVLTNQTANC